MPEIEHIEVVATVIYHERRLLIVRNPHWGFTLPITKLHRRPLGLTAETRWERGDEAALRNVAECLGRTTVDAPGLLLDVGTLCQSDRSGQVNHYAFQVFGFPVDDENLAPGTIAEWLTVDELLDPQRQPISWTARELVRALLGAAPDHGGIFPPPAGPPRSVDSCVALITDGAAAAKRWLCQWNPRWERYFLLGGHIEGRESPEKALGRELNKKLVPGPNDFKLKPRPQPLLWSGWSTSTWRMSNYSTSAFDVQLTAALPAKVAGNRWVGAEEIRSERCADGKRISPTMRIILQELGDL